MKPHSFLPRTDSKLVFVLVMACYSWTLASLLQTLGYAIDLFPRPAELLTARQSGNLVMDLGWLLLFSPIIETLLLVGIIELLRWLHSPPWSQLLVSALVLAALHCIPWPRRGIIVAPSFVIDAFSYLYWRSTSRRSAFGTTACLHALHNIIPAISTIGHALRHA
jgi:hypothetical protein